MKKFDLNIDKILQDWEIKHAVREIISNALDEHKLSGTQEPKIFKDSEGFWHIRDFGRGIKIEHFTQNENVEKLSSQKVIGKFGIGLKDALATFERHRIDISIHSRFGDFTMGKSSKQDFEDLITLHIYLSPPSNSNIGGTDFILKNVTDSDIESAKKFFLQYSGIAKIEQTNIGEILGRENSIGNIYINGVLVAQEENFLFSYNITVLTASIRKALNRERTNVGRTAYAPNVRQILLNSNSKEVHQALMDDLKGFKFGTFHDELKWIDVQEFAVKLLSTQEKVVFVTSDQMISSTDLIDEIGESGSTIIAIPTNLQEKISGQTDFGGSKIRDLSQYAFERNESFEYHFISYDELTEGEKQVYDKMNPLLRLIGGKPYRVKEILISETTQKENDSLQPATGVWDDPRIIIKRSQLSTVESFLGTLLHEIAHAKSYASDVTRRFEQELTGFLGKLASLVVEGITSIQEKEIENSDVRVDYGFPTDGSFVPVQSSNLHSVGYYLSNQTLQIRFKSNGSIYEYYNVPVDIYVSLMNASSKGNFAEANIFSRFHQKRIL
jgi:hypothetical protein